MTNARASKRVGRPHGTAAHSHAAILEAVHALLQERSVRDLTIEEVARRAGVSKPTIYKWWPTKTALVMASFHERIAVYPQPAKALTVEQDLRWRVRRMIDAFNGLFGKVLADMIAEGQSEPALLRDLFAQHIGPRRALTREAVEQGQATGELTADFDPELLIDTLLAPIFFRLMVRHAPLTHEYGEALVSQVLRGAQPRKASVRRASS